jgi:hypothetical protein
VGTKVVDAGDYLRGTAPGAAAAAPGRGASGRTVTHQLLGASKKPTNVFFFRKRKKRPSTPSLSKKKNGMEVKRQPAPVTGDFISLLIRKN